MDLGDAWQALVAVQPPATPRVAVAAALAALAGVVVPSIWRRSRHVVTIAHEGSHGLVAAATGRRLAGIRLHGDSSGLTVSVGRPAGPGMVAMLAAGYTGPAVLGVAAALVLATGRLTLLLWGVLAALTLLLVQIRNWFGLLPVLGSGLVVLAVTWWATSAVQQVFAHALTLFLLLAAPRAVLDLARARRHGRAQTSDADQLARVTGVPAPVWVALFAVVTLLALVLGVSVLVR